MKRNLKNNLSAAVFLLPYGIFYAIFMLWPVFQGAYVSLYKWNLMGKVRFLGFANYIKMFQDSSFWESLWHSALFALISTPLYLIIGFILALICNRNTVFKKFYRIAYFMPFVLSVSVYLLHSGLYLSGTGRFREPVYSYHRHQKRTLMAQRPCSGMVGDPFKHLVVDGRF